MNKTVVRRKQQYVNQNNTIESHRNFGGAIVQHLSDNARGMASDAWGQLLGPLVPERNTKEKISGDLVEGQEITLKYTVNKSPVDNKEKVPALDIEPGINYRREILEGPKKIARENVRLIQRQIEEILIEIKKLSSAQKELEVEFREVAVEQRIVSPGKYHLNFFEWLLSIIRLARMKIEDSGAWLSAFQSKKAKRQYWAMFKKHGTTFGLSNERVVATQTG